MKCWPAFSAALFLAAGVALGQGLYENQPSSESPTPPAPPTTPHPPVTAAPKPAPTESPAPPAPPAAATTRKPSPPKDAELRSALKLVTDVYQNDLSAAKTADAKKTIVRKLLDGAKDESGANRYALLATARDTAIDAGDADGCVTALDTLEASFDLDALKTRADAFLALPRNVRAAADRRKLAELLSATVQSAINADRFDIAKAAGEAEQANASATGDSATIKLANRDLQTEREFDLAYADIKTALATLATTPTDPDASLKVGKYRGFIKADWKTGLPLLALSNDPALKPLAASEIAGPATADDQVKLADGWWDIGDKLTGTAKTNILNHAAQWYRTALPALAKGLLKTKVEKRIAALTETPGDVAYTNPLTPVPPTPPTSSVTPIPPALKPYIGTWMAGNQGDYTLNPDGTISRHDGNTGKWTIKAQGTAVELKWDTGGYVDVFQFEVNHWVKITYRNGIYKSKEDITPPLAHQ